MKTKLFRYPILALALALSNLAVNPPVANGQLASNGLNYSCESRSDGFATMGRSRLGSRAIVTWNNRQPICNTVTDRFIRARDNGNLRFLMREGTNICGTNVNGGECLSFLFSTNTAGTADGLWRKLVDNNTIDSRYIMQSAGRDYFNLELYLEEVPISTNQEISTNQLPSQP